MYNLYSQTRAVNAMRQLFAPLQLANRAGNLEPGEVYPDRLAPIIRNAEGGSFELVRARWGMPSPQSFLKTARDPGVTNVRNTAPPIGDAGWARSTAALWRLRHLLSPWGSGVATIGSLRATMRRCSLPASRSAAGHRCGR